MIDWSARIDDLMAFLAEEYGIEDRMAVEILLSALIPCPRTPAVWIILEYPWYAFQTMGGWFCFGGIWQPYSLAHLRRRYPRRQIEDLVTGWFEAPDEEHLFIEGEYELYPPPTGLTRMPDLLQRSPRIRVRGQRTGFILGALDDLSKERRADRLASLVSQVIEDPVQARPQNPPVFRTPANFLYQLELLQRMAPWYPDWNTLIEAFGHLAIRHAFLEGRSETDQNDTHAIARVAADSVPPWIAVVIRKLLEEPTHGMTLEKLMSLKGKSANAKHGAHEELIRLGRNGLIKWNMQKGTWAILEEHRAGLSQVVNREAFGLPPAHASAS